MRSVDTVFGINTFLYAGVIASKRGFILRLESSVVNIFGQGKPTQY
jgi:hypothetical protein